MIPSDRLTIDKILGSGQFSTAYSGWMTRNFNGGPGSRVRVAIKISHPQEETTDYPKSIAQREELLREAKIMIKLRHRNIVRCYGIAADTFPMQLVLECCSGGTLLVCRSSGPLLPPSALSTSSHNRQIATKFCQGLLCIPTDVCSKFRLD